MANNDRVADVYFRRLDVTETQDACRDRIHWVCEQVTGRRVVDVGCSQGLVPLLLAREGHEVVGIDLEAQPLEVAQRALAKEPRQVQERVQLIQDDAFSTRFEPGTFDSAVCGEILEHLARPEQLLANVAEWLVDGGQLIVSVPHGYHPYHDHQRSFYLASLLDLLGDRFSVREIASISDRYLCAVAVKPPAGHPPEQPSIERMKQWERLVDAATERAQRHACAAQVTLSERARELRQTVDQLTQTERELRQQLQAAQREEAALRREEELARVAVETQWRERVGGLEAKSQERVSGLEKRLEEARQRMRNLESAQQRAQQLQSLKHQMEAAAQRREARVEVLQQQADNAHKKVKRLKAAVAGEKQLREELQQRYYTVREKLEKARDLHQGEKQRRRHTEDRVERLREQVEYYKTEATLRHQEVRYRLGDAFVRAAKPSVDTIKLPFRLTNLFLEGLVRRRQRRREEQERRRKELSKPLRKPVAPATPAAAATPAPAVSKSRAAPPAGQTAPGEQLAPAFSAAGAGPSESGNGKLATLDAPATPGFVSLDSIATLSQPFSCAPPELRRRNDLRVAVVTDEFSWRAWQYEADVYTFTPGNWRQVLEERKPHLLFVESTWSGIDNSWYFQLRDLGQRGEVIKHYAIPDIVAWCRQHDVPTVFYNKEDPPNFDVFIEAAKQFDHVFTSDANCIPDYRKHVGHDRVYALPFAAQPRIHNPIMTGTRTGTVCFAGTWYAHRHFARHEDADKILRPGLDFDLHIFDRMANSGNPNFRWPDIYLSAVRGALPYSQMLAAYKRYRVFLNVNSVTNSPTMFSRRVFELLACGTPVISSYSAGIEELLGADVVLMSDDEERTRELLERLLNDDEYWEELVLRGQRKVFSEHTYAHRLNTVLEAVGLGNGCDARPFVTCVAPVETVADVLAAWQMFQRQRYERKQLLLCTQDTVVAERAAQVAGRDAGVQVVHLGETTWGHTIRQAIEACPDGHLAMINPRDYYGPHYLTDYAHATYYLAEPVIGKARYFSANGDGTPSLAGKAMEYRYVASAYPWTLCLSKSRAQERATQLQGARTPWEWCNRAMRATARIYSPDRFNYVKCQENGRANHASPAASWTGSNPAALTAVSV